MRRFFFLLVLAGLIWWGYPKVFPARAGEVQRGGDPERDRVLEIMGAKSSSQAQVAEAGDAARETPGRGDAVSSEDQAWIAGIRAAEPAALARAWSALGDSSTPSALRGAVRDALSALPSGDADALLAALGEGNGFLRSAEGRLIASKALALVKNQPPAVAIVSMTRLLEKCMRGDIGKRDVDARAFVDEARRELKRLADRTICDPSDLSRARSYTVARGDSLSTIARRFRKEGISVEAMTLALLNRIHNPKTLREGQKIKVPLDPVRTVVEKRSFLMAVYVGERMLRLYWIGHGADDKTPVATFTVTEILPNPQWDAPNGEHYPPGHPKNILGKWFVKLANDYHQGFGVHGTTAPESIGTMASMGCIRMLDEDIDEFANFVPRGTKVEVRETRDLVAGG
ncbi:MAG: hypothetical protein Fur0037_18890 [Planctomycetota bacterium]